MQDLQLLKSLWGKIHTIDFDFLGTTPKAQKTKAKLDHGLHHTEKLLHERSNQQSILTAYRVGQIICKPYI
jgi:hypothetical protein